ncbi:hypothetical protein A4D02_30055 [Niastella koreensis]|uniref:Uncharacterized protein n=2 Tax=Niastella koreensis TaxID=354356 RepID=G8T6P6_NIAKG|nr:hypothetical protein [Niastella koreensis]AEV96891.1 hypothetical protein Niako_0494 [Niastella koreensis GR20-10]OQP49238.1 hypothetical protein A4D02_30055 [Niastella koreensis]
MIEERDWHCCNCIIVKLTRRSKEHGFKGKPLFEATTKEILSAIRNSENQFVAVEDTLFKGELTGTIMNTENSIDVGSFLQFMHFDDDLDVSRSLHYYIEGGKLYICCSPTTARKRVVAWWQKLTPEQKALYNKNH